MPGRIQPTGRIGCKSIENSTGQAYNVISMIYTQFKFDQALITGQIG